MSPHPNPWVGPNVCCMLVHVRYVLYVCPDPYPSPRPLTLNLALPLTLTLTLNLALGLAPTPTLGTLCQRIGSQIGSLDSPSKIVVRSRWRF